MTKQEVIKHFQEKFGNHTPEVYASPGRVNLIGEHTDYNGSFVFPGAIDKGIIAAIRFNGTDKVRAYAIDLDEYTEFGFNEEDLPKEGGRNIFSVYAVRSSSAEKASRVRYRLRGMCHWARGCLLGRD